MKQINFANSIRYKLFIVFFAIVAGLQVFLLVFNANALETVLVYGDKMEMSKLLNKYQHEIDVSGFMTVEEEDILIAQLAYEWDGNLSLINTKTSEVRSTMPMHGMRGGSMDQREELTTDITKRFKSLKSGTVASLVRKDRNGKDSLVIYVGRVNESQLIFSEKPLNILHESSKLVTRYLMISGFFTVLIGSIAILVLSRKLTQPIIEIEEQANRIAAQDFGKLNRVTQKDEIGSLGTAVNQIESALSESINALNEANDKLKDEIENERRLEQLRRLFVSNVSHELKTPMSMIVGYADGLKYGIANKPESIQYYCDVILSESDKMNTLINDLLDMSAYQEGHLPIQLKSLNLSDSVIKTSGLYESQASEQGITLITHVDQDVLVVGDAFRLEQVVRNLISNAFKHVLPSGKIEVTLSQTIEEVSLKVFNEGNPIPEEELEAIWMSFYRGTQAREQQIEGFGIGLALVKEIVHKHNGIVAVENLANGVRFVVTLPIIKDNSGGRMNGSI